MHPLHTLIYTGNDPQIALVRSVHSDNLASQNPHYNVNHLIVDTINMACSPVMLQIIYFIQLHIQPLFIVFPFEVL